MVLICSSGTDTLIRGTPFPSASDAMQYDPQATGSMPYHDLMRNLLDEEDYQKYACGR